MRVGCLVVAVLTAAACGDAPLAYEGTAGAPAPARVRGWVPSVDVRAGDAAPLPFLVDTGAPITMLDRDAYPRAEDGRDEVTLEAFGLRFSDYPVSIFDLFPYEQAPSATLHGILGGDLLRHFALSIDYRQPRAWLREDAGGLPEGVDATALGPVLEASMRLCGGGRAQAPGQCAGGCGTIEVPATRVMVEVHLEGRRCRMLVDTGASAVVLAPEVGAALPDPSRPRLDGVTVGTSSGDAHAFFTRLASLEVGAAQATGVPVLVLPDTTIFDALEAEIDAEVCGLLGGTFLRAYLTTIDYPGRRVLLAPYVDPSHIDPNEFVRVGFTMTQRSGQWYVEDVYPDTDAEAEGLAPGDRIAELDGTPLAGVDESMIATILGRFTLGQDVPVVLLRGGAVVEVGVAVEDLLPAYPSP